MRAFLLRNHSSRAWGWLKLPLTLCLLGLLLCSCAIAETTDSSARRLAEGRLGYKLPDSVKNVKYLYHKWGDDVDLYWVYIKFEAPEDVYYQILKELHYENYHETESAAQLGVPGSLGIPEDQRKAFSMDWWDVTIDFDPSIAVKDYGKVGYSITKYEKGNVYIVFSDR